MSDNELLDLIYEDDIQGLILLVDTYSAIIYKVVARVLSGVATDKEIEDCVADSFMAFYNNAYGIDLLRGDLKAYLGVIANRRALNLYYTLNPDDETVFCEYTVEEMNEILKNESAQEIPEISQRIKVLCIRETVPEDDSATDVSIGDVEEKQNAEETVYEELYDEAEKTQEPIEAKPTVIVKKKTSRLGRVLKTAFAATTLVAVITVAVIAFDRFSVPKYEPVTTTQPTTQSEPYNPLLSAILSGNESLIESLIGNSLLITQDVLEFALKSADKISYDVIRHIAEEVKKKYGSTGLDSVLDDAIFGNYESVRDKLSKKDEEDMTPAEKLAYFFVMSFQ